MITALAWLSLLAGILALVFFLDVLLGLAVGAFADGRGMALVVMQAWTAVLSAGAMLPGVASLLLSRRREAASASPRVARLGIAMGLVALLGTIGAVRL